jgi:hypothetical protein
LVANSNPKPSAMFLIQILLPLFDNSGHRIQRKEFQTVKKELTATFEGLTAYSRSAAEGFWGKGQQTKRDEIVVYEVMVGKIRKSWWKDYRDKLERRFRQDFILIRAHKVKVF